MQNFGLAGEDRIWPGLGWFSGLMCLGSLAGAATWGAFMRAHALEYEIVHSGLSGRQQVFLRDASLSRWNAAFCILYGLEFLCFIVPKLIMLGRLTENTSGSSQAQAVDMDRVRRRWYGSIDGLRRLALPMMFRAMAAAVVLCSMTGMVALDVAAAYEVQAAVLFDQAAAACGAAGNVTVTCSDYHQAVAIATDATTAVSVMGVCEAAALMITALSYLLLVIRNIALYRHAEEVSSSSLKSLLHINECQVSVPAVFADVDYTGAADASVQLSRGSAVEIVEDTQRAAAEQRRRLIAACAVVLVSFPARAAFNLLNSYSQFRYVTLFQSLFCTKRLLLCSDPKNTACGSCDPCQSEQFLINIWLNFTPEFQPIVVAVSSPLAMMWSLWLMMSAWERRHMLLGVDASKEVKQQQMIAARARLGVDFPRPLFSVFFWNRT